MKTSTLIGISLTLLMLLLVLLAAFLFLFQGRQILIQGFEADIATLEKKQAEAELQLINLEGTRTVVERQILTPQAMELETVQAENSLLNQQSVSDLQELEALRTVVAQTAEGTPVAAETPQAALLQPATIEIVSPENNEQISLASDIDVVIAARDDKGIATIELMVNNEVQAMVAGDGRTFFTHKESISFVAAGNQVLEAKLTNLNGDVTMTQPLRIEVVSPSDNGG